MPIALKQFILVMAVLAIALVFVVQFRPGTDVQSATETCAVEQEGRCVVSHADFVTAYRLASPSGGDGDDAKSQVRPLIIEGLVQRWLLVEDAARLGVGVSEAEVTRQLSRGFARVSLPADQESFANYIGLAEPPQGPARNMGALDPKTNRFDYARYEKFVQRATAKTLKDFREYQDKEALAARMRQLVKARVRISESEALADFTGKNAKIVVDYAKLERAFYQRHALDQSEAALKAWTDQNQKEVDEAFAARKESFLPECRLVRQIMVRIDDTAGDKELAKKKASDKLELAKKRLESGDKFADVARELSEDPQSATSGGQLGCFAPGKLAKPNTTKALDDAALTLAKGKLSDVIESTFGLHLVRLDAVLSGEDAEREGKRETARELYSKKEGESRAAEASKQILAAVKGGKTLAAAIEAHLAELTLPGKADAEASAKARAALRGDLGCPRVETSEEFSLGSPPFAGVENPADAGRLLFGIEQIGGLPNDVLKLYDGYAVAQLKEKKSPTTKDWEEKRDESIARMREAKQRDAIVAYVHELREKHAKNLTYKIALREEPKNKAAK
ncbi:MAG: hypothetical protein EXR75_04885 [Myxococcales bacterium]|nr:hypothetical protein [Myxococcales bacterium]